MIAVEGKVKRNSLDDFTSKLAPIHYTLQAKFGIRDAMTCVGLLLGMATLIRLLLAD
jgi:hypothetical protein